MAGFHLIVGEGFGSLSLSSEVMTMDGYRGGLVVVGEFLGAKYLI